MNWLTWVGKRLGHLLPVLLGISVISFGLIQLTPGDPARMILGNKASVEAVEAVRERMGLNEPVLTQYGNYMLNLVQGDLGESLRYQQPVSELIMQFLPATGFLALYVIVITVPLTILLGIIAARNRGRWIDQVIRMMSVLGMTMPVFWLAMLMLRLFRCLSRWHRFADLFAGGSARRKIALREAMVWGRGLVGGLARRAG